MQVRKRRSPFAIAAVAFLSALPFAGHAQSASYSGTPYSGTAPRVPIVLPAADFDKGGEGVAYHDLSSGNLGGQYRSEGVDIYTSSDSAFGRYKIANFQTREWMSYSVDVPENGYYELSIRAANDLESGASGAFRIEVDGVNLTGTISVPNTGSWETYQWFGKKAVLLTAGKHVVKLISEQQWFDVTALSIQASTAPTGMPYGDAPIAAPATFPAVAFDKGGEGVAYHDLSSGNLGGLYRTSEGVDIYPSTDSAGGPYKVQNFQTGEWMSYTVDVPANGNYDLGIRAANDLENGASGAFRIEVDGVDVTGTVSVSNTGGWSTYQWFGKRGVPLAAGKHVVKLVSAQQWFDVTAISIQASAGGGSDGYAGTPFSGTPVAAPATFPAVNFDKGGEGVAYHDLSSGNLGGLYRASESVDIYASTDSATGPYQVKNFQTGEWMSYLVDVPADGNYDLGIRAANNLANGASGAFRVEVDGVDVTGTVSVSNTGSWSTYQWFGKRGVSLAAGKHVVKLVSEQQWFDVSALTIHKSADGGTGTPPPDAELLWTAGFEDGTLREFEGENNSGSADSVAVRASAEGIPARSGSWVMKQSVLGSSGGTRVYNYSTIDDIYRSGEPIYYSFWSYFPQATKFDGGSGYFNLLQIQSMNSSGGTDPVWILGYHPSNFTLRLEWWGSLKMTGPHAGESGGKRYDTSVRIPVGQWVYMQVMVVPREDFTGAVRVWMNDRMLFDLQNVRTKYPESAVRAGTQSFFIGKNAYGQAISPTPNHHYVDDVAISLQPRPYAP